MNGTGSTPRKSTGPMRPVTVSVNGHTMQLAVSPTAGVSDVLKACVESSVLAEGEALGFRVGSRFLTQGMSLQPPWYNDGEPLVAVMWQRFDPTFGAGLRGPQLVVTGGAGSGQSFPLRPGEFTVGRDKRCDICLESSSVSSNHAKITVDQNGNVFVKDLGATNGTAIGLTPVGSQPVPVAVGDVVYFGACRVTLMASPAVSSGLGPIADDGRRPFYRAARLVAAPAPVELAVPDLPSVPDAKPKFNWVALAVPLLIGLAMAVFFNPTMAIFAILGPIMSIATYFQERKRLRSLKVEVEQQIATAERHLGIDAGAERDRETIRRELYVPDPGAVLARCAGPSPELWHRRVSRSTDALVVHVGRADLMWRPPIRGGGEPDSPNRPPSFVPHLVEKPILDSPVPVKLPYGAAFGIVANKVSARGIARSLVAQAATLVGPGELKITILADLSTASDVEDWSWAAILPHTQNPDSTLGVPALVAKPGDVEVLLEEHERSVRSSNVSGNKILGFDGGGNRPSIVHLIVAEIGVLNDNARTLLRRLVEAGASGHTCVSVIALAPSPDLLPSFCSDLLTVTDAHVGLGELVALERGTIRDVLLATTPISAAVTAAELLCGLRDPESVDGAQTLPSNVSLVPLLALGSNSSEFANSIARRWQGGKTDIATGFRAVLGAGEDGVFEIDFVTDGPHALVGGTTGSGKSELLRSLVAAVSATYSPQDANFVLVDYKGGSAFDVCADLPHVVGMVTDLDEQLGERALISLEAELHWREHLLRNAEASDFPAYRRDPKNAHTPLARLMVIIDEFATMAKELPDFLNALIGIAQRGRSLGVHMLLATQRPSGVVNENIKANTNLRIALRVQDSADSHDVLGNPSAATISRRLPGRAYARLGPGETVRFQSARIPSSLQPSSSSKEAPPVVVLNSGQRQNNAVAVDESVETLVRAVREVWVDQGSFVARRPWLAPLPDRFGLVEMFAASAAMVPSNVGVVVGLLDEPSRQQQRPFSWTRSHGNVALCGLPGSGSSATLLALAYQLSLGFGPDDLHLYALDYGEGILAPIEALPHTGAVITPMERERLTRFLRMLRTEIDNRRASVGDGTSHAMFMVFVDNFSGVLAALDDINTGARDDFARMVADGPALGCYFFLVGDRPGAFPIAVSATLATKWVFRLADPADVVQFGIDRKSSPPPIVGRALVVPEKLAVQMLAVDADDISSLASNLSGQQALRRPPKNIRSLPERVDTKELLASVLISDEGWFLPIGLGDDRLAAEGFHLRAGEHALVTSPAHAGKSTTLRTLADVAYAGGATISLLAYRRTPVQAFGAFSATCTRANDLEDFLRSVRELAEQGPHLLLIDDAEAIDDSSGLLVALATERIENLRIIVAARGDVLRSKFGHWTVEIRRSRAGLVLRPVIDMDGDLWFTTLPRKGPARFRDGLGYIIAGGIPQLIQVAISD
jgi:DNA segregation ATPase FtsK/SpoIIIE, S-DNA-T family